jgi:cytochrome c556
MHKLALMAAIAAAVLCAGGIAMARLPSDAIGTPSPARFVADGRQAVPVSDPTRALILGEMRRMVAVIEAVDEAANGRDWAAVARAARKAGAFQTFPDRATMELPADFRRMGRQTRLAFDAIAEVAGRSDPFAVNANLANAMEYCVACHKTYRLTQKP